MKSRKGTATGPIRTLAVINIVDIAVIRQHNRYVQVNTKFDDT